MMKKTKAPTMRPEKKASLMWDNVRHEPHRGQHEGARNREGVSRRNTLGLASSEELGHDGRRFLVERFDLRVPA